MSDCIFRGMPPESYRIMRDEYKRIVAASLDNGTAGGGLGN